MAALPPPPSQPRASRASLAPVRRAAQASTESRIFYFTAAESAFVVCLSITQAVVVRRFLNNRQWV